PLSAILYGTSVCALTAPSRATAAKAPPIWKSNLAKSFRRDCLEPFHRFIRLPRTHLTRCIDSACGAAFDLGEDRVPWHVDPGKRKRVSRGDRAVTDARQPRRFRRLAGQQVHDRRRTRL